MFSSTIHMHMIHSAEIILTAVIVHLNIIEIEVNLLISVMLEIPGITDYT